MLQVRPSSWPGGCYTHRFWRSSGESIERPFDPIDSFHGVADGYTVLRSSPAAINWFDPGRPGAWVWDTASQITRTISWGMMMP